MTSLYNERPAWLQLAHETLDRAVLAAYTEIDPDGGWSEEWAEVWKETGAGWPLADDHVLKARRAEIDQRVLGNLLRLNQLRAGRQVELRAGKGFASSKSGEASRRRVPKARSGAMSDAK